MRIAEFSRVGALARCFDFDETNQRLADNGGIVRTRLQVRLCRLPYEIDSAGRQARDFGEVMYQRFQRAAKLIFRRAADRGVRQLGFDARAELRDGVCDSFAGQRLISPNLVACGT